LEYRNIVSIFRSSKSFCPLSKRIFSSFFPNRMGTIMRFPRHFKIRLSCRTVTKVGCFTYSYSFFACCQRKQICIDNPPTFMECSIINLTSLPNTVGLMMLPRIWTALSPRWVILHSYCHCCLYGFCFMWFSSPSCDLCMKILKTRRKRSTEFSCNLRVLRTAHMNRVDLFLSRCSANTPTKNTKWETKLRV
jgi:hypothetical protein